MTLLKHRQTGMNSPKRTAFRPRTHRSSRPGRTCYGGGARFVKYRGLLYPLNLWMVTDFWRTNQIFSN